jgi:hypothetical protein
MIKLHDCESGALLGTITEEQLKVLVEQLEEESPEDRDYYIDADTIEMFEEAGVDAGLVDVLKKALNGRPDMDVRWSRE